MKLICPICDYDLMVGKPTDLRNDVNLWTAHNIQTRTLTITIVTCPSCSEKPLAEIDQGYRKRILEGRDDRFH